MQIRCFAFNNNDVFPPRYRTMSPPLDILGVPTQAKSLALIMHDPDAVSGDYTHWVIWDIDPKTTTILEDSVPTGAVEGTNDAHTTGYIGPRPPQGSGRHRYTFELFALDTMLDLLPQTPTDELMTHIAKHSITSAQLVAIIDA